jgi:hypothetical protein
LSNINDKVILETKSEASELKVKFENLLLRGGDYYVTFSLNTGSNAHCDLWRDVLTMTISDVKLGNYLAKSPFKFEAKWQVYE